jgi:hypothetical protein
MQSAKEAAKAMLDAVPDDASYADIRYRLYVLEQVEEGLQSLEVEGPVSHEDARKQLAAWLST